MKKYYCDRCNKEITSGMVKYEIDVRHPGSVLYSADRDPIFDKPFHLCDECMKDLSMWIRLKEV